MNKAKCVRACTHAHTHLEKRKSFFSSLVEWSPDLAHWDWLFLLPIISPYSCFCPDSQIQRPSLRLWRNQDKTALPDKLIKVSHPGFITKEHFLLYRWRQVVINFLGHLCIHLLTSFPEEERTGVTSTTFCSRSFLLQTLSCDGALGNRATPKCPYTSPT